MGEYLSRQLMGSLEKLITPGKVVFRKALSFMASLYPEPTRENVLEPNTLILLDIRDKFFKYYDLPSNRSLFEDALKLGICKYEEDPHYRYILCWFLEELVEKVMSGEWKPRPSGEPSFAWEEPRVDGGLGGDHGKYRGRKFSGLIERTPN